MRDSLKFKREILNPNAVSKELGPGFDCWAYRYAHPTAPWKLVIATLVPPESQKLSLGGFRIVPKARAVDGFSPLAEAAGLARGMDEKVHWSRLMRIGGGRGLAKIDSIVGGKCVMLPSDGSRIGEPRDREMLDFAAECLRDAEGHGFSIVTGQDLGHGMMSDGATSSLEYLHHAFDGSVLQDTSRPTSEGNFYVLKGMLAGFDLELEQTRGAFIGCGKVGSRLVHRAVESGMRASFIEPDDDRSRELRQLGAERKNAADKQSLLSGEIDALIVNANGSSLDHETVLTASRNRRLKVVTGAENLCMPDERDEQVLLAAEKLFCPTELAGMMGYLTAVEEYLCRQAGEALSIDALFEAARLLEEPAREAVRFCRRKSFQLTFAAAIQQIYQ